VLLSCCMVSTANNSCAPTSPNNEKSPTPRPIHLSKLFVPGSLLEPRWWYWHDILKCQWILSSWSHATTQKCKILTYILTKTWNLVHNYWAGSSAHVWQAINIYHNSYLSNLYVTGGLNQQKNCQNLKSYQQWLLTITTVNISIQLM